MLENDRTIRISAGASRFAARWPVREFTLREFYQKLAVPVRSSESRAAYLAMGKKKQDELKDVGGFVGGVLTGGVRKNGNVAGRDLITLDIDRAAAGSTGDLLRRLSALGCGWAVYSTRKHGPEAPRLRVIVPADRTLAPDEYEPVARKLAAAIDPEMLVFDPTTFQVARMMYWPSCCSDSEYVFEFEDKPLLCADGMLAQYADWRDTALWPQVPGAADNLHRAAEKAENPTEKQGVVGAFCRTYSIYDVLDTFLPGVYEATDKDDRFTFAGGSTTGGAVVYDGLYLYSHHATDPAGGRLCNAFDLVRLHRFSEKDDDAKPNTPANKLPSYAEMCRLAVSDGAVADALNAERYARTLDDFGSGAPAPPTDETETAPDNINWMRQLDTNTSGAPEKTLKNFKLYLLNHPGLAGRTRLNLFTGRIDVCGALPWERPPGNTLWSDTDTTNLRVWLESQCGKTPKNDVADAVEACAALSAYHPVRDYLTALRWDGAPRLDAMLVDYLGAEDSEYTRAVTRKAFVAAVARVMTPGVKYDTMPVFIGAQGRHKSSLLGKMGGAWFSDSLKTFDGKDAMESIQGTWLNEVSEMQAMQRSEVNAVKAFLSKQTDYYRAAYGRHVAEHPRQCVFFGTSNTHDVLTDPTGGRRFLPVNIDMRPRTKNVFIHLEAERDQLWAEALVRWRLGETLHLQGLIEDAARASQEDHREQHPWEGLIQEFVEKAVPRDWQKWDLPRRRMFWGGGVQGATVELAPRDRVCALEIWCEALGGETKNMRRADTLTVNSILNRLAGWERTANGARFGYCGLQKGFQRVLL